ncbi:hypothetical protein Ddc_18293 [Ditylenchus destructor]|nr:hypothetical protein Ddc_18293 [Ditylenchus destructor]
MSNSTPLPSFTFDVLCYLNRDQLERFSIVCRPFKNLIKRYFYSKPYRVFDNLFVREGSYVLIDNCVQWHPNRDDYSVQQFLAGHLLNVGFTYYSYAEMRAYLGPTVRIKETFIYDNTYDTEHIAEMESIAYLWRDGDIDLRNVESGSRIRAENFQLILNSPTILQCQKLVMINAHFSFKDYNVLYLVKVIEAHYYRDIGCEYWLQFLEQPGAKPIVVLRQFCGILCIDNLLNRLSKAFSSAVSPNAFKIVFPDYAKSLTEFREVNKTSGEMMEFKKGLPSEYQIEAWTGYGNYTLERYSV